MTDTAVALNRINELRQKQASGTTLSDDEVREGLSLLADIRASRAGKNADTPPKSKKDPLPSASDFF